MEFGPSIWRSARTSRRKFRWSSRPARKPRCSPRSGVTRSSPSSVTACRRSRAKPCCSRQTWTRSTCSTPKAASGWNRSADAGGRVRYELMLPHQIRTAIDGNWPVVLPLGVLEYHGEHMAVGMDTLAVTKILEILENEANLVILPPFYYGAASYAVARPERTGTLHVDAEALMPVAKAMFTGLLRIGFRNIHLVIHHQTENFAAGMPTDLAFKFAARQAIFAFLEAERGEAWWGAESMADYYQKHSTGDDPFNWIKAHPLMLSSAMGGYPFGHRG